MSYPNVELLTAIRELTFATRLLESTINELVKYAPLGEEKKKSEIVPETNSSELNNLLPVKDFIRTYPSFTDGGIRSLIFHEKTNGFDRCVKRIGRKLLIEVKEFHLWIEENNKK